MSLVLLSPSSQDYHSLLFGSGRSVASLASNVSHALCLPISLQEVLESNLTDSSTEVSQRCAGEGACPDRESLSCRGA